MDTLFALAGPAEAGLAGMWGMAFLANIFIGFLVLVVVCTGRRTAAIVWLSIWGLLGCCVQPWDFFFLKPSEDYDWESFRTAFEDQGHLWAGVSVALWGISAIVFVMRTLGLKKPKPAPDFDSRNNGLTGLGAVGSTLKKFDTRLFYRVVFLILLILSLLLVALLAD